MEQYHRAVERRNDDRVRVGWIGTPETWASFAEKFSSWIAEVARQESVIFRVIGAEATPRRDGAFEFLPWSEEAEISLIKGMDIGLMPLPDTPWTRGKCGYKLIQYMACSLPVIASPVGVNRDIVEHGVNGFLATSEDEWRASLLALIRDPKLRLRMGEAGLKKVEKSYSLQTQGPRMAQLLRCIAENNVIG